ncbi:MAG: PQQ-dependent sugar dehydrogenase [Sandaracinus sp.]|nr:PQQ-dependent sugar dehydrogenase [Sandaracinus sp.]MCB9619147.1 PQQ-dependent sugar dehydrogenase [Sandaracinus sp.]MCB9632730.1 PQQ-dependent sugar dehydrogenase [Sandaracinus sp.]
MLAGLRSGTLAFAVLGVLGLACHDPQPVSDAGFDAGFDGGSDGGLDAPMDVPELPDAPDAGPPPPWLTFERVPFEGEPAQVTDFVFLPGPRDAEPELLVVTRDGRLLHHRLTEEGTHQLAEAAIPDVHVDLDCGVISIVLAPDFETSGDVYLGVCFSVRESGVIRARFDRVAGTLDPPVEILRAGHPEATYAWHNVGSIGFENDEVLFAFFGDKTIAPSAEDPGSPTGALLRVIPRAEGGHDPAPGNPAESDVRFHPDVFAYGLRSPWKGLFHEGRWIVGDVGNFGREEVSVLESAGSFLGWPRAEGPCNERCADITDPVVEPRASWGRHDTEPYVVDDPFATSHTGHVAYVGLVHPADAEDDRYAGFLDDAILFGDACVGFVRALDLDGPRDEAVGHLFGASGYRRGPDGYVYATSFGRCTSTRDSVYTPGGLWRAHLSTRPPERERPSDFPERLSELGLFPHAPELHDVPSWAVFYEPEFPLYTNGLGKLRHVVNVGDGPRRVDDRYEIPPGTLFFKTFLADGEGGVGRPIETRVIRVEEEGVSYAGYRWNEEGTDATRLPLDEAVEVDVQVGGSAVRHAIPSERQCVSCHEAGARRILGFDPYQLDGLVAYDDPATREIVGWAYGNCVHCHDGSGGPLASFSMRPGSFLANTIDRPTEGSASGVGLRVAPGRPDESALLLAVQGGDEARGLAPMPPLGVEVRDEAAIARLRDWIAELSTEE